MKIFIDTNIGRRATTHVTEMAPRGIKWGPHYLTVDVAQRIHRPPRADEAFIKEQLPYLATLCTSAREGMVEFFTAFELQMEELRQKGPSVGRLGINLLRDVPMKKIPSPIQRSILIGATASIGVTEEEQMDFFRSIQNPRFLQIRKAIGEAHIDDAFHLWTAEEASLDALLTLDRRFRNVVYNKRKNIKSVVPVMAPKELCEQLGLRSSDIKTLAAQINPFS